MGILYCGRLLTHRGNGECGKERESKCKFLHASTICRKHEESLKANTYVCYARVCELFGLCKPTRADADWTANRSIEMCIAGKIEKSRRQIRSKRNDTADGREPRRTDALRRTAVCGCTSSHQVRRLTVGAICQASCAPVLVSLTLEVLRVPKVVKPMRRRAEVVESEIEFVATDQV